MATPRKYFNMPTVVDGYKFASKKEAKRYGELKLLQRVGKIRNLVLQPKYPITVNKMRVCTYVGDFLYDEVATGLPVLEDVKGVRTWVYKLKKALLWAVWGIRIVEI